MIRVCHMTSAHGPEDVRIFHKECTSIAQAGYEVYLVERGESYEKNDVHIVGVGEIPRNRLKRMTEGAKKVYRKALALNCDIYHFHDPELLPYGLKLKRKGKKVIFDSHENTVEQIKEKTWIPNWIRKTLYFIFDKYQRYACRRFDSIISVTPHICDYFKQCNENTIMVTNYPRLQTTQERERERNTLCFAGGIDKQWGHEKIIHALEHIPDCRYILCGRAEENYLGTLKKLPGWFQTDYRGVLPHESVNGVLSSAFVGMAVLSYSNNTAFSLGTLGNTKVFEEMMAGLPVICTGFELWKEFVQRYDCGICVDPENTDEIASAIRYLLDHPEEARRMGENGRRAVEQEFNWGMEEMKLLSLYEGLTNGAK